MKNLVLFIVVFFTIFFIAFSSCKKEDSTNTDDNTSVDSTKSVYNTGSVNSSIIANSVYNDVVNLVLVKGDDETAKNLNTCPDVSTTPIVGYPKTLTIDFGIGCTYNGTTISGKIIAVLSDRIRLSGTTVSVSFDNYRVDTLAIDGTIELTIDNYTLSTGVFTVSDEITNANITTPTHTISFAASQTITWDTKATYSDPTDDEFSFYNGSSSGIGNDGAFSTEILDTLLYKVSCTEMVSGEWKIETANIEYPSTINFGNGTCDGKAMVTTTVHIVYAGQSYYRDYSYEINLW